MQGLYDDLTPEERVAHIELEALKLVHLAQDLGVCLRIDRVPLQPLAMGHARSVVDAWPERERVITMQCGTQFRDNREAGVREVLPVKPVEHVVINHVVVPREMSDREWAAQPAGLREGCTVHVPGVGDL